ncbi:MAG: hypothetical protein KIT13_01985 [Burkholderiales bacterium]|nr:hypothetical protein [Burkholderiales bacterium]
MNKQSSSASNILGQLPLTASQRTRLQDKMRQSEFLAGLMVSAFRAIKSVVAKPARRLGTAG